MLQKGIMTTLDRRRLLAGLSVLASGFGMAGPLRAQGSLQAEAQPERRRFGFNDVVGRAQKLAAAPFDGNVPQLPPVFEAMDWDKWRQIRFRPEKALLRGGGSRFSLQTFHLGYLFNRPVTINVAREGTYAPVPYATDLFDYGPLNLPRRLPIDLGFAGFRIHYPLNDPKEQDELISFLGSSYFRWLGRDQKYGLSARALAINTGKLDNKRLTLERSVWRRLSYAWIVFFALLGGANLYVAYHYSESTWVNFKLFGTLGLMLLFMVVQGFWLASKLPADDAG